MTTTPAFESTPTAPKYQLGDPHNLSFLQSESHELLDFGQRFPWPGGGASYLDDDGNPVPKEGLYTYESGRYAHAYALGSALGLPSKERALELSAASLRGLTDGQLRDREHGGWYTRVAEDGTPDPDKSCYAHSFVILGASSALTVGVPGAKELLDEALDVYERYFWDDSEGMPLDTWDTAFTKPESYRGINASMHSVEAFLAASDALGTPKYRMWAGRVIERVIGFAADFDWKIPEHFDEQWNPLPNYNIDNKDDQFKPYGTTPGHSLEWARLISQWAVSAHRHGEIDDDRLHWAIESAQRLFLTAVANGWNADGGTGLVYTIDWDGTPVVRDRMHWTLAEGINTASYLARLSTPSGPAAPETFSGWYATFWQYVDEHMIDHDKGSWFHQLDADNRVIGTVWPGKPDIYHALQATLIPTIDDPDLLGLSILPAIIAKRSV